MTGPAARARYGGTSWSLVLLLLLGVNVWTAWAKPLVLEPLTIFNDSSNLIPQPSIGHRIDYFVEDRGRLAIVTTWTRLIQAIAKDADLASTLFGPDQEVPNSAIQEGDPYSMYALLKRAEGTDRPFNWALVSWTFHKLISEALPKYRTGAMMPLLRFQVYDILRDGTSKMSATGLVGKLSQSGSGNQQNSSLISVE